MSCDKTQYSWVFSTAGYESEISSDLPTQPGLGIEEKLLSEILCPPSFLTLSKRSAYKGI